jgi:hypothetical protein
VLNGGIFSGQSVRGVNSQMRQTIFRERAFQTGRHVYELSKLLKWFLYQSSAAERQRLRTETLEWADFTALVRAMASEAEFAALVRGGTLRMPKKGSVAGAVE